MGKTFATLCDIENDSTVEIAGMVEIGGMGEFVSVVNFFWDLVSRYDVD